MRLFVITAGAAVLSAQMAGAVALDTFTGDATFIDDCGKGSGRAEFCELAVGEFRIGTAAEDNTASGDWEVGTRDIDMSSIIFPPTPTVVKPSEDTLQANWQSGEVVSFRLEYFADADPTLRRFELEAAGMTTGPDPVVVSSVNVDLDAAGDVRGNEAQGLYIRLRNAENAGVAESTLLTNMILTGTNGAHAIPDLGGFVANGVEYLALGEGFDWTSDWALTGNLAFDFRTNPDGTKLGGAATDGSSLAVQFKVADFAPATVPLPAAGWLLLGGVGALAALGRRARRG